MNILNNKVNLLIIGSQKAGTTSLYHYIKQHTEVYFSEVKEITYFVEDQLYAKGEEYYHSFFPKFNNQKVIASAYVHMFPSKKAPKRVYDYNKDMRFIVMTRDPKERAFSAYNYAIKNGWEDENISFEKALELEPERIKKEQFDLMYFYNGLYNKHLKFWENYFPKENFLIIKDTELKNNPEKVLDKISLFLNIKIQKNIDFSKEYNKAGKVRFKRLQKFLLSKNSTLKKISGKIFPRSTKVWIRANVLSKIYSFNQVNKANGKWGTEIDEKLNDYYKKN